MADAEACFQQSLALARDQGAKWYELRTTVCLAKLRQAQGRGDEAYRALTEIYNWFTEGFDTPDLQEAKQVIESGKKYKES